MLFKMHRVILFICILFSHIMGNAAVTKVKFLMEYKHATDVFECKFVVTMGSATTANDRTQFGPQYTIVMPINSTYTITQRFMPLQGNIDYSGTVPAQWTTGTAGYDANYLYVPVSFNTSPVCRYNNLVLNDTIKLFNIKVTVPSGICKTTVRLYENNVDPNNMQGGDFSSGLPIGSTVQDYDGNLYIPFADYTTNRNNSGVGSLRKSIECAQNGATIYAIDSILNKTITLLDKITIDKNIFIKQTAAGILTIEGGLNDFAFQINAGKTFDIKYINIVGRNTSSAYGGRCVKNSGTFVLNGNVKLIDPTLGLGGSSVLNNGTINVLNTNNRITKVL